MVADPRSRFFHEHHRQTESSTHSLTLWHARLRNVTGNNKFKKKNDFNYKLLRIILLTIIVAPILIS